MTIGQVLFKFSGRIGRQEFWLKGVIPQIIYSILAMVIILGINISSFESIEAGIEPELSPAFMLFYIPALWMSLAVAIKRFHDRDKSGWWVLIQLIPLIGMLWILIENGFLKGTGGANRFGADPLA